MVGDASNTEALRRVLDLGLLSAGGGAALRSLAGLRDLFTRGPSLRTQPSKRPAVVEVNVPDVVEEDAPDYPPIKTPALRKFAGEDPNLYVPPSLEPAITAPGSSNSGIFSPNWFAGRTTSEIGNKPWYNTALGASILGGGALGYTAVDKLVNKLKKNDKEKELENAKDEYRRALIEQYTPDSPNIKRSEDTGLGRDLDELYSLVKEANLSNLAGWGMNQYLPLAALLAGGAGAATYNWTKARSPEERLSKAIKQRERLRWATRPPEIYAITRPAPVRVSKEEDEENNFSQASPESEALVRKTAETKKAEQIASLYKP